jgi:hypothetical protein
MEVRPFKKDQDQERLSRELEFYPRIEISSSVERNLEIIIGGKPPRTVLLTE